jgi:ABC-type phosphate/phosphonate transport system substrate-binding protein
MARQGERHFAVAGLLVALALSGTARTAEDLQSGTVRVGLIKSLMRDTPEALYPTVLHPMKALITSQTGLQGELSVVNTPEELGRELTDGKQQLGVFHGFEFAWVRQTNPKLKPLVIAVCHNQCLHAYVVVRNDAQVSSLADLRGQTFALPQFSREHCRLFLERECLKCGATMSHFFSKVTSAANVEQALDLVVTGRVAATVVDGVFLEWYCEHKAARFAELKKVAGSEAFPAGVIAYNPDRLSPTAADRLRQGLLNASKNDRGAKILGLCQITRFETPSEDFDRLLTAIAQSYPPTVDTKGR